MKKALSNTKVTVKLRKSVHHDNEWYLFIESYPVYKKGAFSCGNTTPSARSPRQTRGSSSPKSSRASSARLRRWVHRSRIGI